MKNNHVSVLEIDLNAIEFNLNHFNSKLQNGTKIIAVVKAFGYGSDAVEIAKFIQKKVAYFAVAYTDEGIALRKAGITTPILVLHPHTVNFNLDIAYDLEPNLYNRRIFDAFLSIIKEKNLTHYPIHIKFNTGLNRLGFEIDDIPFILSKLKKNNGIKIASVFSHLAASEDKNEREFTLEQIAAYEKAYANLECHLGYTPKKHITNTSGIINYPQAHYDMVRLGIGLYGFGNDETQTAKLKNVFTLKSIISQIHTIEKGQSVGYNRAFIAKKQIETATIPIGHADGINRSWGNGVGYVTIQNQKAPIVGNVCMDMIMVDVTNIECEESDEVIVFDDQKTVKELAEKSNTITYELLTAISQRIRRVVKVN